MNRPTSSSKPKSIPSAGTTTGAAAECGECGSRDGFPLHNVWLRKICRRVCTSCVLRLHPASFCPSCFTVYESSPPPPSKRYSCSKCSSSTHTHCASPPPASSPFLCPRCADPKFVYFRLPETRAIDKNLAAVLLCAARIASSSMASAAALARKEAEDRVRDASVCRKKAREALEQVALAVSKDQIGKSKEVDSSSVEVSGSGNLMKMEGALVTCDDFMRSINGGNDNMENGSSEAKPTASVKEEL